MCGWQVKLCDPLVTHGPHLSALEMVLYINLYSPTSGYKDRNIQTYKYGKKATKEKKQRKNSEQDKPLYKFILLYLPITMTYSVSQKKVAPL